MGNKLLPTRLRVARQIMGYSLEKLASLVKMRVTKQSLSRYEAGSMKPKKELLEAIAGALGVSPPYFEGLNVKLDNAMLRTSSGGKLSDTDVENIEAALSYRIEKYINKSELSKKSLSFYNPLSDRIIDNFYDIFEAADQLRAVWKCGDGAIPSIIRLLERKGVLVFEAKLPDGVMGLSTWANGKYPVIVIDVRTEKTTVERLRFTVTHELAHLLLRFVDGMNVEKGCDKFAGFFLLPAGTFKEEVGDKREELYLDELIDLREAYGVSVAALVHQALDLDVITRKHYDWWYNEMIGRNVRETGWGQYCFPEVLSKEKRMDIIINNIKHKQS